MATDSYGAWAGPGSQFRVRQWYSGATDNGSGYTVTCNRIIYVSVPSGGSGFRGTNVTTNYAGTVTLYKSNAGSVTFTRSPSYGGTVSDGYIYAQYRGGSGTLYHSQTDNISYTAPNYVCKITYNANGGSGAPAQQTYNYASSGTTTLSSTIPRREGYNFKGWSLSSTATSASYSAGQGWNLNNKGNFTLYAVWQVNIVHLAYNPNGGTVSASGYGYNDYGWVAKNGNTWFHDIPYGRSDDPYNASSFGLTRTGYTFDGNWYLYNSSEGITSTGLNQDTVYGSTTFYDYSNKSLNTSNTKEVHCYLYAGWSANKIKITLAKNGGSGGTDAIWYYFDTNKYYSNEACTTQITTITIPTKTGYTYVQYNGDGTVGGSNGERYIYTNGTFASDLCTDIYANATLTAQWTVNDYTIAYNANGGSGAPSSTTYTYASSGTINLSSTEPTRSGYIFLGWSTSSIATSATYSAGGSFSKATASNTTLYAVWKAIDKVNLTFSNVSYTITNTTAGKANITALNIPFTLTNVTSTNTSKSYWYTPWYYTKGGIKTTLTQRGPSTIESSGSGTLTLSADEITDYLKNTHNINAIEMNVDVWTADNTLIVTKASTSFFATINNYTKPKCEVLTAHRLSNNNIYVKARIIYPASYSNLGNVTPILKWGTTTLGTVATVKQISTNVYEYIYEISASSANGASTVSIYYTDDIFDSTGEKRVAASAADQIFKIIKSSGICYAFEFIET